MVPILVVEIDPVERGVASMLERPLTAFLSARVILNGGNLLDGSFAWNTSRNQYESTLLLAALLNKFSGFEGKILGITSGDLFVPVLTYVFGEAQLEGRAAVVSSHRLHDEFYGLAQNNSVFTSRLVKESIHELGHTFGLLHCSDYLCVMHSSTGVEEIDIKSEKLCRRCNSLLSSLAR